MLELAGIRVDVDAIHELDEAEPIVSVALPDVRSIVLRFGLSAERPLAGLVFGTFLAAVGLAISTVVLRDLLGGRFLDGNAAAYLGTSPVTFLLGIWLCRHSLRKQFFLEVQLTNDSRKLPFRGKVQREQVESFMREVSQMGNWAHVVRDPSRPSPGGARRPTSC